MESTLLAGDVAERAAKRKQRPGQDLLLQGSDEHAHTLLRHSPAASTLQRRFIVRDLVVVEYVSLDGVIQAPGYDGEDSDGGFAHGGWTGPFMAEHRRYNSRLYPTASGFLLGRRTYEIFAATWPTVTDPTDRIAHALNTRPKYVAATTPFEPAWQGTTVLTGEVAEQVAKLKQQPDHGGPLLLVGSATLAQTLAAHHLVDEYQLMVHPVVLGGGKRLFDDRDGHRMGLRLVDSTTTEGGLLLLTYHTRTGRSA